MSWAEVKKINNNLAKPLDTLINELDTGKITPMQTNVNNINTRTTSMQTTLNTVNTNVNTIRTSTNKNLSYKSLSKYYSTAGTDTTTITGSGVVLFCAIHTAYYSSGNYSSGAITIDGIKYGVSGSNSNIAGTYFLQPSDNNTQAYTFKRSSDTAQIIIPFKNSIIIDLTVLSNQGARCMVGYSLYQ